jgi:serine protease Do
MRLLPIASLVLLLSAVTSAQAEQANGLAAFERDLQAAVALIRPRVVSITSHEENGKETDTRRRRRHRRGPRYRFSGILISRDGHVVTVADAIHGKARIAVMLLGGRTFDARVVGYDRLTNVGVLKIESADLPHVSSSASKEVKVGSLAIAVGNPFGLHHSVSTGIVSGRDRDIRGRGYIFRGMIQTTAPINPGDAGGFLGDSRGRFMGMITSTFGRSPSSGRVRHLIQGWIRQFSSDPELFRSLVEYIIRRRFGPVKGSEPSKEDLEFEKKLKEKFSDLDRELDGGGKKKGNRTGDNLPGREAAFGAQGINFVMPGHRVLAIAREILQKGHVTRGTIGASGTSASRLTSAKREKLGLGARQGVILDRVAEGGPAAAAGLRQGDLLLGFGGKPVSSLEDLQELVFGTKPGSRVTALVWRNGQEESITLEVAKWKDRQEEKKKE